MAVRWSTDRFGTTSGRSTPRRSRRPSILLHRLRSRGRCSLAPAAWRPLGSGGISHARDSGPPARYRVPHRSMRPSGAMRTTAGGDAFDRRSRPLDLCRTAAPPIIWRGTCAGVAELADATDSKSVAPEGACRFDSCHRHDPTSSPISIRSRADPSRSEAGRPAFGGGIGLRRPSGRSDHPRSRIDAASRRDRRCWSLKGSARSDLRPFQPPRGDLAAPTACAPRNHYSSTAATV